MPARSKKFQRQLDKAVKDPHLSLALTRGLTTIRDRRNAAFSELDFEGMRSEFRAIKEQSIQNLPTLIEQFTREAEAIGAVDQQRVRRRHVDAALDDRGGEQQIESSVVEVEHDLLELALGQSPVRHAKVRFGHFLRTIILGSLVLAIESLSLLWGRDPCAGHDVGGNGDSLAAWFLAPFT
jgi:hypothetical protein